MTYDARNRHRNPRATLDLRAISALVAVLFVAMAATGCPSNNDNNGRRFVETYPDFGTRDSGSGDDMGPADMGSDAMSPLDGGSDAGDSMDMGPDAGCMETEQEICQRLGKECGPLTAEDICGEQREIDSCGDETVVCGPNEACGAGGEPGVCGCTPKTCVSEGILCGPIDNGCGQMIQCDQFCVENVVSGGSHSCATGSGKIKCWGENGDGQLGNQSTTDAKNPVGVANLTDDVIGIAVGRSHTCAILSDESLKCWGDNDRGQLGVGTTVDTNAPGLSALPGNVKQIDAGDEHTCALVEENPMTEGKTVYCWGSNQYLAVGDPSLDVNSSAAAPRKLPEPMLDDRVVQVATGAFHTCALDVEGAVWCWGLNDYGQVGQVTSETESYPVADMNGNISFVDVIFYDVWVDLPLELPAINAAMKLDGIGLAEKIVAGRQYTCMLLTNQTITCLGSFVKEALRDECPIRSGSSFKDPDYCSVWPQTGPQSYEWRRNVDKERQTQDGYPQVGDALVDHFSHHGPNGTPQSLPAASGTGTWKVGELYGGRQHVCAIVTQPDMTTSNVQCMGNNRYGQVGDGTSSHANTPQRLLRDVNDTVVRATKLGLGANHSCALDNQNNVLCWGSNASGQIGNQALQRDESFRPYNVRLQ